jgi:hypothetical protein
VLRPWAFVLTAIVSGQIVAQAPQWQFHSADDGSYFAGRIAPVEDTGLMFVCGERSPRGLTADQTGNMEPDITPRDTLRLYLPEALIGRYDGRVDKRQDVMIVAGSTGYRLQMVRYNELFATWEVDLQAENAVFPAIASQAVLELRSTSGKQLIPASGFGAAHAALIAYCQSMFTAIGRPWTTVAPASPPRVDMRQVAEAEIRARCGGPAETDGTTFHIGNIDGDGADDVVVFWNGITCSGGSPRPFCGASACSVQIFLSARHGKGRNPDDLLARSVRLQPLTNGTMGVVTVGETANCRGRPGCGFIWYWNGAEMAQLP